jgi:signal transduction histidine kinase
VVVLDNNRSIEVRNVTQNKVLIVEDERIVALDLQYQLRRLGYTVSDVASSGEEALRRTEKTRPDVVLMDIRLGGTLDGVETAEILRDQFDVPVVFLTAYADDRTLQRAKASEPFGYLLKPFEERELQIAIELALYRHSMEQQLREYAAELETRNRELDAYAHTVAHDLKHPLSLIVGYADVLLSEEGTTTQEVLQVCARGIAGTARKMNSVIDELLLLAEVRKADVNMEPLDMGNIINAARKRLQPMIEQHEAEISLPDTWPAVLGHEPWVEQVWVNYLSNAIKYGGERPRIELGTDIDQATRPSGRSVRFWVRDHGPGLTEEEQEQLFTPFTRLGNRRAEGHGLGLSIVQRIVEKLDGEVGVESRPGEGSTFYFTLRPARRTASDSPPEDVRPGGLRDTAETAPGSSLFSSCAVALT